MIDFNKLVENKWLTEKEAKDFFNKKDVKSCIEAINVIPVKDKILNVFNELTPETVKVLIIGKDPYPDSNKANGYAFSVENRTMDDSIGNIFKAVDKYNHDNKIEHNPNLNEWAIRNGVLLLNSALTYDNSSYSKRKKIWQDFINMIIKSLIISNDNNLVVFLWGDEAKDTFFSDLKKIEKNKVKRKILVCASNHPSNLSENRGGNFSILAPVHFEVCDKFLSTLFLVIS